ncbi:hypothetical protein Tco_0123437 [Tanacetum coccineum]
MSDLKFADTHNLVVFLEKPTESEVFKEIVNFLNANPIKYALTVNPTIYWSLDKKKVIITESTIRRDLQLEDANGVDCLPNAVIFEQLTLMGYEKLSQKLTFYKAFFSPQWKFLIHKILQCLSAKTIAWNEFSSTMASAIICLATNQKFNFSKYIFDNMVKNVDTHEEMGKGSEIPTDPHHTPIIRPSTSQPHKKQSRRKQRKDTEIPHSSGPTEHIADEVANEKNIPTQSNDPPLSRTAQAKVIASLKKRVKKLERKRKSKTPRMKRLFKFGRPAQAISSEDEGVLDEQEVEVEKVVSTAEVTTESATITTVDELTLAQTLIKIKAAKPKVRGVMIQEPSEFTTTTTTTTPAALKPSQDKAEEQEELTIEEKSKKFQQLLEKRRKHFAAKRAEERRSKPPTKAQQRSIMTTYLKNMAGWKPKDLKNKSFASVQELFENAMKRVNIFVDMDTELVEGSKIREEESSSKRVEEDVAIDVIPLAIKPAPIVNFQIHRKGRNNYYEIKRADGSAKTYLLFSQLLKEFDREDLENLWKLVKAKHGNTRPEQGYKRVLWGDLKTMFEHHIER